MKDEKSAGNDARRVGEEGLFDALAEDNIQTLENCDFQHILTTDPHTYNTLLNEYPSKGGVYSVKHYLTLLTELIQSGDIKITKPLKIKGTYHDPCYLGRANQVYEAPRKLIKKLDAELLEMKNCKEKGLCCGAGGAQMFKEPEKGNKDVNIERTEQALKTKPDIIAAACPFCNTMMSDGVTNKERDKNVEVKDIAELIASAEGM